MNDRPLLSRPEVRRAALAISGVGFVVAAAVHVAAVLGIDLTGGRTAPFVALHVGIFPLFFAALASLVADTADVPKQAKLKRLVGSVPRAWRYAVIALFYYAFVNFGLFMLETRGGSAHRQGDAYLLTSHGRVVRQLTREEYEAMEVWRVRGFSGHWMVFYMVPVLVFGVVRLRPDAGAAPKENPLVRDA